MSEALKVFLARYQLQPVNTPGDGDCFFHALKMVLNLTDDVQTMRVNVVRNMDKLFDKSVESQGVVNAVSEFGGTVLFKDILDKSRYTTWKVYRAAMSKPGEWADDPCIWSAVHLYDVKITVYVSIGTVRIFDKLPSWGVGFTSRSVSIGNLNQFHYVATEPLDGSRNPRFGDNGVDSSGSGSESELDDSALGDLMKDLGMLDPEPGGSDEGDDEFAEMLTLREMYKQTFEEATVQKGRLQQLKFSKVSLAKAMLKKDIRKGTRKKINEIRKHKKKAEKQEDQREMMAYLRVLQEVVMNDDTLGISDKLNRMIEKDYTLSNLDADAYKAEFESLTYADRAVKLIVSWFTESETKKMVVDPEKKNKLLRIIHMAIKVGLNYQMLEPFTSKFLPPTEDITSEEYSELFKGVKVTEEALAEYRDRMKKVKIGDLKSHPYWENIRVFPDLTNFVTVHALKTLKTDQLINTVKRTTLYRVYNVSRDYRLNLDEAAASDLQQLCSLTTLKLAQKVRAAATKYFKGTRDSENIRNMEAMYNEWLNSSKSFKLYNKPIENDFFRIPELAFKAEISVNEVIADVSKLPGLLWYTKNEDPGVESVKNGALPLSDAPADPNFAKELSRMFVEMGFLPEGYERYCGVKAGVANPKRATDGTESPAKRQRRKLFTPLEIH